MTTLLQVRVEEEKLKVYWKPASIETWLEENDHKGLQVEFYVVTIFPKESINTSFVTKIKEDRDKEGNYSAWFYDLQGGKTEYVLTIACVLGRSRMKGEQVRSQQDQVFYRVRPTSDPRCSRVCCPGGLRSLGRGW